MPALCFFRARFMVRVRLRLTVAWAFPGAEFSEARLLEFKDGDNHEHGFVIHANLLRRKKRFLLCKFTT